jgi:hypothetical protein
LQSLREHIRATALSCRYRQTRSRTVIFLPVDQMI